MLLLWLLEVITTIWGLIPGKVRGGSAPPEEAAGIEYVLISVPDQDTLDSIIDAAREVTRVEKSGDEDFIVRDPSGIALRFKVRAEA